MGNDQEEIEKFIYPYHLYRYREEKMKYTDEQRKALQVLDDEIEAIQKESAKAFRAGDVKAFRELDMRMSEIEKKHDELRSQFIKENGGY